MIEQLDGYLYIGGNGATMETPERVLAAMQVIFS